MVIAGGIAVSVSGPGWGANDQASYSDVGAADEWMQKWVHAPHALSMPLEVGRFADPMYFLLKPIGWDPNPGQALQPVAVPEHFVTDFASIPRAFWSALRPDGDYAYAAIIHDWLYWQQNTSKEDADLVLKYAMQDLKVDSAKINVIYTAVKLGGGDAWRTNASLKAAGEKRILKKLPTDPTIRWAGWKNRPDVF